MSRNCSPPGERTRHPPSGHPTFPVRRPKSSVDRALGAGAFMSASGSSYIATAHTREDGTSVATVKRTEIPFDSSPIQGDVLPGPADLLTAAFAACMLKNVERFGQILLFDWRHASVEVCSERQDAPPMITTIHYRLTVVTNETAQRVDLLHRNLTRHGTIFNTLAAACTVTGEIIAQATTSADLAIDGSANDPQP